MTQLDPFQSAPAAALAHALDNPAGDKRLEVLRRVALGDSISQAAREVGISYKAAWQAIDTLTNLSGVALVDRTVGGCGGGGARITAQGLALLALANELAGARRQVLARFAAGAALISSLGLRTSMRNQLPCTVVQCQAHAAHDPMATVTLHTPGGALLHASVTWESADLLGLTAGLAVLVLCKATAVEVVACADAASPAPAPAQKLAPTQPTTCQLIGMVERVTPGPQRCEVVLALDGGGHWVGFATAPFDVSTGQRAAARMSATALVVGLGG